MATTALSAAVQVASLLILSHQLETDEAVEAFIASGLLRVPRLYRPTINYQYHRFRLSDLDDITVQEFTR